MTPTFDNYVRGGCEIQLSVAIDFSASNGSHLQPGSLHYLDPTGRQNDYEKVISAIGGSLATYDSDCRMPVWGFGANFNGQTFNLFQVGPTAEVDGIQGVLQAYRQTFSSGMVMSGPTVVTQVIDTAAAFARKGQDEARRVGRLKYGVLLIITNGDVSDVNATVASLQRASDSPLSIVVVGVGNYNFAAMNQLGSQLHQRNMFQFVQFNAHGTSLTHVTMNGISSQLVDYFQRNGIQPSQPATGGPYIPVDVGGAVGYRGVKDGEVNS